MRRLFFLLLLLGSPALHAEPGFISRLLNHPVPGAWPWYHWEAGPRHPQCAIRTSLCW